MSNISYPLSRRRIIVGIGIPVLLLSGAIGGCGASHTDRTAMRILFSPSGKEYACPSWELWERATRAQGADRERLLDDVVHVLEEQEGFSRYVAADFLLGFHGDTDGRFLTERAAVAMAKTLISIGGFIPDYITKEELSKKLFKSLNVRCAVRAGGKYFQLREDLPKGWVGAEWKIVLDGRIVTEHKGREMCHALLTEWVYLPDLIPEKQLHGEHTIVAYVSAIAPNGCRIPLKHEARFTVETEEERRKRRGRLTTEETREMRQ
ncbi:MAG TPA: hypothetical protein VNA25_24340 [Phycisphaerae bacterium]|nr:hypothetical protein [Phycisphaerae bacterium]HUT60989.1 hypothetical protein [Phycisphaerae bacterium]